MTQRKRPQVGNDERSVEEAATCATALDAATDASPQLRDRRLSRSMRFAEG